MENKRIVYDRKFIPPGEEGFTEFYDNYFHDRDMIIERNLTFKGRLDKYITISGLVYWMFTTKEVDSVDIAGNKLEFMIDDNGEEALYLMPDTRIVGIKEIEEVLKDDGLIYTIEWLDTLFTAGSLLRLKYTLCRYAPSIIYIKDDEINKIVKKDNISTSEIVLHNPGSVMNGTLSKIYEQKIRESDMENIIEDDGEFMRYSMQSKVTILADANKKVPPPYHGKDFVIYFKDADNIERSFTFKNGEMYIYVKITYPIIGYYAEYFNRDVYPSVHLADVLCKSDRFVLDDFEEFLREWRVTEYQSKDNICSELYKKINEKIMEGWKD